ncbi:MAG: anti sigma factor C-terminal domain-containing protein [Senegalia sp. (in: firmicutes)]|uniref:anti sigma factor C-terminal domain-containing protein n=2 Tax=Senegalia sp. (in: firmicutes) TaxID=1924098 RepID=UPI003F9D699B
MKSNLDDNLEEKNLNQKLKKMKRKSIFKTTIISILISIVVLTIGVFSNIYINIKESEKAQEIENILTKLRIPNGYISEASYDFGVLGGNANYKISKEVGPKSVVLRDYRKQYGLLPIPGSMHYYSGVWAVRDNEEIAPDFWDTGYRKMIFYHPKIKYEMYKNDLEVLDQIPEGKFIEMGISFDKEYDMNDVSIMLADVNVSWVWLDLFTDQYMDEIKYAAQNYDANAAYIPENDILGVSFHRIDVGTSRVLNSRVEDLFDLLDKSPIDEYSKIYEKYHDKEEPKMLGAIVYGTKDELMKLKDNPHIKATSIGVVEDIY